MCVNMHACELTAPSAFLKTSTGLYICDHDPPNSQHPYQSLLIAIFHLLPVCVLLMTNEGDSGCAGSPSRTHSFPKWSLSTPASFSLYMLGYSQEPDPHPHNTASRCGVGGGGRGREAALRTSQKRKDLEEEGESQAKSSPCCGNEETT